MQRQGEWFFLALSGQESLELMEAVRHPDHRPLFLDAWNRVIPNSEAARDRLRLKWID